MRSTRILPGLIHDPGACQFGFDLVFCCAIKHRGNGAEAQAFGRPAKVNFQHLTDIHTSRNTERIQDDIHRRAIFKERHVFHRDDLGNNTLITMTACHFITRGDLAALGNRDTHHHIHTGREIRILFAGEDFDIHDLAALAMRHAQGGIFHIAGFLTEDGPQKALFRRQFLLTLSA